MDVESDFMRLEADLYSLQQWYKGRKQTEYITIEYMNDFARILNGDNIDIPNIHMDESHIFHDELIRIYEQYPDNAEIVGAFADGLGSLFSATYLGDFREKEGIIFFEKLRAIYEKNPYNEKVAVAYARSNYVAYVDMDKNKFLLEEYRNLFRNTPNNYWVLYYYANTIKRLVYKKCDFVRPEEVESLANKLRELIEVHPDYNIEALYSDMLGVLKEIETAPM